MVGTPAGAHVGGTVNHLWGHLKPKADARYARNFVEAPHVVGTVGQPAFNNGGIGDCQWGSYGGGWDSVSFYKDRWGVVHVNGLAEATDAGGSTCDFFVGSDDDPIFVLPSGYRPALAHLYVANVSNAGAGAAATRINVFADGTVAVEGLAADAGAEDWISLEGISFRAAPAEPTAARVKYRSG